MQRLPNRRRLLLIGLLVVGVVVLLMPVVAMARAGGGGGYRSSGGGSRGGGSSWSSGGSSRSGGGGGDISGLFYLIFKLFELAFRYPLIGVPSLIVVGYFVYRSYSSFTVARDASVIRRGLNARRRQDIPALVGAVRRTDPDFVPNAFLARVRNVFPRVQAAWSRQDLADVRHFLSDAVHERFSLQFQEQKSLGWRNQMDAVTIQYLGLADVRTDDCFDEIDVRIEASAIDQTVALDTGRRLEGSNRAEAFVEYWTFLRRRGTRTKRDAEGLMEGRCPNCGGVLAMNESANCPYCGALLRSGQYDWVLVEITQECEYEPRPPQAKPGEEAIRKRDPNFNVQSLEDRASVMFWRYAAAVRTNSIKPLRKVASDGFCELFERHWLAPPGRPRSYLGQCAVGAVNLLCLFKHSGRDYALIEVRWTGWHFDVSDGGQPRRGGASAIVRSLLLLGRDATAVTNPDQALASAHCPTCGAPERGGTEPACSYCGTVLNDGAHAWRLEQWESASTPGGQALLEQWRLTTMADPPHRPRWVVPTAVGASATAIGGYEALVWMAKMSLVDGHLEKRERKMLKETADRYHVSEEKLQAIITAAETGQIELPPVNDREAAKAQLAAMTRCALADGKISPDEDRLLHTTAEQLGLGRYDIDLLIKRTRADLLQEARAALKAERALVKAIR